MPSSTGTARAERPLGVQLFASAPDDPRGRRPTDLAAAIASLLAIIMITVAASVAGDLDDALTTFLEKFPSFFDPLWLALVWAPVVWSAALLLLALVRRRPTLARDIVVGVAVSVVIALIVAAIATDDTWATLRQFADVNGPPAFPPAAITIAAAAISVPSPHLSRPFRHLGRWLLGGQVVASMFLGAARCSGALVALAIGLLAATLVHLAVGSPGGRPTASRIRLALGELGVHVSKLEPAPGAAEGVVRFVGADATGPIAVKVYGRDAWDAQLLANLWRLLWYRSSRRTARLSRIELVEHEGFITLLAERAGVRTPQLVTAGSAGLGDALVVVRPEGVPLREQMPAPSDEALDGVWRDLDRLHDAGITLRRLDLDRIVARDDGSLGFGDLAAAAVAESAADRRQDDAQLLALGILLVGEERAGAAARRALGDDGLLGVLPYLQAPALVGSVRDALDAGDIDLDDVRDHLRNALGAPEQPLIKLRRVTAGSLVNLALLAFATYALIGLFGDLDLATFADELRDAKWWWLVFALILAQLPRIANALSTMGSLEQPLAFGPLVALHFAICYVNLAIPSTAARLAVTIRYFERVGVRPATAVSASGIDSVSGFIVQIGIFLTMFFVADLDLGLSSDLSDTSGLSSVVLIVIAVIVVVAVVLVVAVRPIRTRVVDAYHQARAALRVLRSPVKVLQLFGGNLLSQVLFAVALSACCIAFSAPVPLSELLLINTVVSLFAGLLPIPGGIGVSEAGLTWGLTAAGLPSETAFAIAIAYRLVSFYLPPIWGFAAYQGLVKRRYL